MKARRARLLYIFIHTTFAFLLSALIYMQMVRADYYRDLSQNNHIRILPLEAPRGTIYDRNGVKIAGNELAFDLLLLPQEIKRSSEGVRRLAEALGIDAGEIDKKLASRKGGGFTPVVLRRNIDKDEVMAIEEKTSGLSGITVNTRPRRFYPYRAASNILGYVGEIGAGELKRLKAYGYRPKDFIGRSGLEESYDGYLRGSSGGLQAEVDSMGRVRRILGRKGPRKGKDIYTTIDIRLQGFAAQALEGRKGAVIIMDPETGEVLAMSSSPNYDPNVFVRGEERRIKYFVNSADKPLINRAISAEYPPGSTFKVVIALAALEAGKIGVDEVLECRGVYHFAGEDFRCWKREGHGYQNIVQAIIHSCNVFFYQAGRRTGIDIIDKMADDFGFGRKSGIDLPYEKSGLLPSPVWKRRYRSTRWYEGDTINISVGQGYLTATPIQVLRMISAAANGGRIVRPYLVRRIDDVNASNRYADTLDISSANLDIVKDALHRVVADDTGTGRKARVRGLSVAGKTGTAQVSRGRPHAWFVGFAPAEEPKIALVVLLENGGKGGLNASRTAAELFAFARELGYLQDR